MISGIELTTNGQEGALGAHRLDYLTFLEKGVDELLKEKDKREATAASKREEPNLMKQRANEHRNSKSLQQVFDSAFAGMRHAREAFTPQLAPREVGTITSIATGIAKVSGLPGVGFEEVLRFAGDVYGIAFNVDEDEIWRGSAGRNYWQLRLRAMKSNRRGHVMDVPVGDELIGRIINPLGRPALWTRNG